MDHSKRRMLVTGVAALVALTFAPVASAQQWKPTKPITIIVPWAAGGSTDQVTRVTAAEIEKALGQKVIVVNQPGASGSIGTKNALEAPKDGYTWTAGAAQDLGTYAVLGMLDTKIGDWALFLNVANVSTLSVNPNTPYKTADRADRRDEGQARRDQRRDGRRQLQRPQRDGSDRQGDRRQVQARHLRRRQSGRRATVAGETDATSQLTVEQAEMIRGKKLRPLAVIGDKPVEIDGYGIDRAADEIGARLQGAGQLLRHLHPEGRAAGSDRDGREDLGRADRHLRRAEAVRDEPRRAVRARYAGADAQKAVFPAVQANAWSAADTGKAKVAPDTLGIPRP